MMGMCSLQNKHCKKQTKLGFTLLEVLIAMAIFSLISLAGVTILNTVINSKENSAKHIARLNEIQRAFLIMERDFLQISRRSIRIAGEKPLTGFIHTDQQNFDSTSLAFVRGGWRNPGLVMPRSDMQSVAYQLKGNTLERLHFNFVDAIEDQKPKKRPLLSQVNSVIFEYYLDNKWEKQLTGKGLPEAIAIEVDLADYGVIRREFLVAGDISTKKVKARS